MLLKKFEALETSILDNNAMTDEIRLIVDTFSVDLFVTKSVYGVVTAQKSLRNHIKSLSNVTHKTKCYMLTLLETLGSEIDNYVLPT